MWQNIISELRDSDDAIRLLGLLEEVGPEFLQITGGETLLGSRDLADHLIQELMPAVGSAEIKQLKLAADKQDSNYGKKWKGNIAT